MLTCKALVNAVVLLTLPGISSAGDVLSDPASAKYTLSAFAIGDWGTTTDRGSCCSGKFDFFDLHAEKIVGTLMDIEAGSSIIKPKVVLGHGDNFYWTGINSLEGRDARFKVTFEDKFNGSNIKNVAWANVMGNHDYGGAAYICSKGDDVAKCSSTEAMLKGLENKFKWQSEYTSPNVDRWHMEDRFYVHTIKDADSGVSIDIFNVDTNDADVHGGAMVCCQCYGYANGDDSGCNSVVRGHKYCCGGNTAMYDACYNKFVQWGNDSRTQLAERAAASNATWKLVNSHFSPYEHYNEAGMNLWFDALKGSGINAFLYGHTHGEKHDYSSSLGIHFVENGAGGGMKKESASQIPSYATKYVKAEWAYTPNEYGFFSVQASKDWLKQQYHTADDKWVFTEDFNNMTIGGVATKHCWYIPADGTEGKAC
ncbi:unnamed protein product [Phytophthora lilii]|uniref:Unnamed protein product n=1 Tax=Phytophthora lilii TaxID=2077276 RepID=A0A9W7CS60_9STRA|nr:unnamed protein product [Phytophthora lilii]